MLERVELEPISDEEVEEASGESATALTNGASQPRDVETATFQVTKVDTVLEAEWSEVMSGGLKASSGGRRHCFDANYFLPTIGICAQYLNEKILDEAPTVGGDGRRIIEMTMKNYAATKRLRLLSDVGSSYRRVMSARVDLKMRRQLCGLVPDVSKFFYWCIGFLR